MNLQTEDCPSCDGEESTPCQECGGDGTVYYEDDEGREQSDSCEYCDGRGCVGCDYCEGAGQVGVIPLPPVGDVVVVRACVSNPGPPRFQPGLHMEGLIAEIVRVHDTRLDDQDPSAVRFRVRFRRNLATSILAYQHITHVQPPPADASCTYLDF